MKNFPHESDDDRETADGSAVQEVLGELTERPVSKPATRVDPADSRPKKTGQISRDVYRD